LYSSPNITRKIKSRRMKWHARERRGEYARFWWESPKDRELGRPRHRWEDGIRMDLKRDWLGECRVDTVGSG
jgi:hypothetical protein